MEVWKIVERSKTGDVMIHGITGDIQTAMSFVDGLTAGLQTEEKSTIDSVMIKAWPKDKPTNWTTYTIFIDPVVL